MATPLIDVEQVVREVLAQLGLARAAEPATAPAAVPAASEPPAPVKPAADPVQLVLTQRVVTLAALGERLQGVRRLVVPPHAVITPLVRDELRKRHIELVIRGPEPSQPGSGQRLMFVVAGSYDPATLAGVLASEPIQLEIERTNCLMAASDRLAAELTKDKTIGLLATGHPAVALCLANRLAGVRAVLGLDAATVASDAAAVGANLLVVNPRAHGLAALRQLVLQFVRADHECPELFRKRLG